MITYKLGTEVDKKDIHKAFHAGFIDYIMKVDLPEDFFFKHFFGPEANSFDLVIIAYHDATPVGIVMGGIKPFDGGAKTMRCGGLCVVPEFRGKGISLELMRRHRQMAIDNGCKQIMLEVIGSNDRAIQFYKKIGYSVVYQLDYYSIDAKNLKARTLDDIVITEIEKMALQSLMPTLIDIHMNWQNDFLYIAMQENVHIYAIHEPSDESTENKIVSYIAVDKRGKIHQLWTHTTHRYKGYALALLHHACRAHGCEKMMMSFPNSATLWGFAQKVGFQKEGLYQYEMYSTL